MEKEQTTSAKVTLTAGSLKRFTDSVFNVVGNAPATIQVLAADNKLVANVKNLDSTMAGAIEEEVIDITGDDMEFGVLNFQSLLSVSKTFKAKDEILLAATESSKGKGFVIGTTKSKFNFPFASEVACELTLSPGRFTKMEPIYTMDIGMDTLTDLIRGSKVSKVGYDKAIFHNNGTLKVLNSGIGSNMVYTINEEDSSPEAELSRPILIEHLKKCLQVLKAYGEGCKIHIYETDRGIGLATPGMSMMCATAIESKYQ